MNRDIYCAGCDRITSARLTDGKEIYSHREDLANLPFWKCDGCGNYVGCHHKTKNRTAPLGSIPTAKMRHIRRMIHGKLDPLWQLNKASRADLYARMTERLGFRYHTATLSTEQLCWTALNAAREIADEIDCNC